MQIDFTDLYVEGTDFYFDGDLRLKGNTEITNGSLIVTGTLTLVQTEDEQCSLNIFNGSLTAKDLWVETYEGHVTGSWDDLCNSFIVENGDIHITSGNLDIGNSNITGVCNIYIDKGDLVCGDIGSAYSIYVNGTISSAYVRALFDIYCHKGEFWNDVFCGRDMYVEEECNLKENGLFVKGSFEAGNLINTRATRVGK